jgi:hypothetical protein
MKREQKGANKNRSIINEKIITYCECCDVSVSKNSNFKRHLLSKKHIKFEQLYLAKNEEDPKGSQKGAKREQNSKIICNCGRHFKTRSGLWKHKQKCSDGNSENPNKDVSKMFPNVSKCFQNVSKMETKTRATGNLLTVHQQLEQLRLQKAQLEVQKLKKEILIMDDNKSENNLTQKLVESIGKIAGNNNCNNTNNISVNMYLNQNCKNAMSLTDFVENIKMSLQDLDYTKENGYVKGIANVFLNQLKDLSPTERPIHCSDTKRLKFYVKDENNWVAENSDNKIEDTIKNIQSEHVKKLGEWEDLHPNFEEDPKLLNEWQSTLENISGGTKKELTRNQTKIKKEISKMVDLTKELKN